jgi:hypothetical protein
MDVDLRIAIPRQLPVLQEPQSLIREINGHPHPKNRRVAASSMTCGASPGAQWSVALPAPRSQDALSDPDPNGAADPRPGDLASRGARLALAGHPARAARSGRGASGHHRRRCGSRGVRG